MKKYLLILSAILISVLCQAQQLEWYNPEKAGFNVMQGQILPSEQRECIYHRLPVRFKDSVRSRVWNLSKMSAGETICFSTDSRTIKVKYTLSRGHSMAHMPATGVSGMDLYTRDKDGKEVWLKANYSFKDTCVYTYGPIELENSDDRYHSYTLYLPLYNEVSFLEIGVDEGAKFRFEIPSQSRPVVAYGTSICQGACASRPAMAWTNILQRRLDRTVVNLGFSGNCMMEKEVIDILAEVDAAIYIFDGMPNLFAVPAPSLQDTLVKAVRRLREKRPDTPIVLTDHCGYPHGKAVKKAREEEKHALESLEAAYKQLLDEGIDGLYRLRYEDIGMQAEMTVEGIHMSDYGMTAYADAYESLLKKILKKSPGRTVVSKRSRTN